jgi:Na+-driven multidrug efflux pump
MIKTIKLSLITAFCLTFVGFLSFELIPQVLLGMFNASEDMLAIGIPALRIIGVHYLIAWFCIICGTVFQALGKAVYSMIVSILRQLVVLIPVAYLLSRIGGLHVVWWCFPIAEVASLVVSLTFLFSVNRQIISKIPDGSDIL